MLPLGIFINILREKFYLDLDLGLDLDYYVRGLQKSEFFCPDPDKIFFLKC